MAAKFQQRHYEAFADLLGKAHAQAATKTEKVVVGRLQREIEMLFEDDNDKFKPKLFEDRINQVFFDSKEWVKG